MTGGRRKLVCVAELTGMEGDTICLHDIFRFNQVGIDDDGHAYGQFEACGVRPHMLDRLLAEGVEVPSNFFQRRVLVNSKSVVDKKVLEKK
jgi:pilus assembly protein CpaF